MPKTDKTLVELKEDYEKAQRDKQNLTQNLVMVEGVLMYLARKLQEKEAK